MRFSVLIELFFYFSVLDDFSTVLRFLIGPNAPLGLKWRFAFLLLIGNTEYSVQGN